MQRECDRKEKNRLLKMFVYEQELRKQGYVTIAGVDEAGRGPLAGPVVAAACIVPEHCFISHLNDSKQLSSELRETLFVEITNTPHLLFGIGIVSQERIDEINILQATFEAMRIAVANLSTKPDALLIDGNQLPSFDIFVRGIVKGDALSLSIAAASVIAKVTRDRIMIEEAKKWPHYGFAQHKGYATSQHLEAIRLQGPCPLHRKSFEPMKTLDQQLHFL